MRGCYPSPSVLSEVPRPATLATLVLPSPGNLLWMCEGGGGGSPTASEVETSWQGSGAKNRECPLPPCSPRVVGSGCPKQKQAALPQGTVILDRFHQLRVRQQGGNFFSCLGQSWALLFSCLFTRASCNDWFSSR